MAHKRRSFLLFLSTIAICAVVGGVYGPRVEVASAATDEDSIRASFKTFTKVYSLVEDNFADPVNPEFSAKAAEGVDRVNVALGYVF